MSFSLYAYSISIVSAMHPSLFMSQCLNAFALATTIFWIIFILFFRIEYRQVVIWHDRYIPLEEQQDKMNSRWTAAIHPPATVFWCTGVKSAVHTVVADSRAYRVSCSAQRQKRLSAKKKTINGSTAGWQWGRMKWDHLKDSVHSLLRDNSVEAIATKTLGPLSVLEPAVTVHVEKAYITLG